MRVGEYVDGGDVLEDDVEGIDSGPRDNCLCMVVYTMLVVIQDNIWYDKKKEHKIKMISLILVTSQPVMGLITAHNN